MVNELATHMTRASAPAPSVETILHALLPHKYVDHTHADAVLAITNTADGEQAHRRDLRRQGRDHSLRHAGLRPGAAVRGALPAAGRQEHHRHGADEARHLFVRRHREAVLRAHDRAGRSRGALSRAAQAPGSSRRRRPSAVANSRSVSRSPLLRAEISRVRRQSADRRRPPGRADPVVRAPPRRRDRIPARPGDAGPRDPHQARADGRARRRGLRAARTASTSTDMRRKPRNPRPCSTRRRASSSIQELGMCAAGRSAKDAAIVADLYTSTRST